MRTALYEPVAVAESWSVRCWLGRCRYWWFLWRCERGTPHSLDGIWHLSAVLSQPLGKADAPPGAMGFWRTLRIYLSYHAQAAPAPSSVSVHTLRGVPPHGGTSSAPTVLGLSRRYDDLFDGR